MKELYRKIVRSSGRLTDIIPVAALASVLLVMFGSLLSGIVQKTEFHSGLMGLITESESVSAFMSMYLLFGGIWVLALLIMLIFPANHPMLRAFGRNGRGNSFRSLLLGALLGFCANGVCVLISWIMGDIKLSYNGIDPVVLIGFMAAVFVQSGAEEITDRLYLYQKLRRRYRSPWVAVLVNSAVFMSMHLGNDGFGILAGVQIFLVGLLFSLFIYYYDALWTAMSFHMAWNYTQNIIFGLPNSGIVSEYSIFKLEAASARSGLFYNVNFGVEGSVGASLVLLLMVVYVLVKNRGRGELCDHWADQEASGDAARRERDRQAELRKSSQA